MAEAAVTRILWRESTDEIGEVEENGGRHRTRRVIRRVEQRCQASQCVSTPPGVVTGYRRVCDECAMKWMAVCNGTDQRHTAAIQKASQRTAIQKANRREEVLATQNQADLQLAEDICKAKSDEDRFQICVHRTARYKTHALHERTVKLQYQIQHFSKAIPISPGSMDLVKKKWHKATQLFEQGYVVKWGDSGMGGDPVPYEDMQKWWREVPINMRMVQLALRQYVREDLGEDVGGLRAGACRKTRAE